METPRECYELAEECEKQAAIAGSDRAREMLLELASDGEGWAPT